MKRTCNSVILALTFVITSGQLLSDYELRSDLLTSHWDASWVKVPGTPGYGYGVYFFRNQIELESIPESYIIHVSADNRYKLFINEEWIGLGPARSDADNWNFETYDIAPYLKQGKNIIAAEVWNYGKLKPWAQISQFTAFIVQGDSKQSSALNTPGNWLCREVEAYRPMEVDRKALGTFIVVGPGDIVDGNKYPWNWKSNGYHDIDWVRPEILYPGSPKGVGTDITHALVPRTIPAMELKKITSPVIRKINPGPVSNGRKKALAGFTVPPNSTTSFLLDQEELVTAYPELSISGGKDSEIKLTYAESLFNQEGKKLHRDSVSDSYFRGNSDLFISNGNDIQQYTTLWFRTFRYIFMEVSTGEEPLTINNLTSVFTAYPFEEKAYFNSDKESIDAIWQVGWRTSRLCANELYFDCPYYEQMQYVGDTRIQALITLYVSGDDRLMRKSITDYYNSIIPEGLTLSRYPTDPRQIIPTYSLFWISMIHDYLWHRSDYGFAARYLVSMQHILHWFENRIDIRTGMLGPLEYWPFVDWTDQWPWDSEKRMGGVPPGGQEGKSSIITLQYAMSLDQAADIFSIYGLDDLASEYSKKADALIEATRKYCWDSSRGLFADTPDKRSFSQHANTLAILTNAIPPNDQPLFMEKVIRDKSLVQASLYFRYYVNRAVIDAGLGHKYISLLEPWEKMIDQGLTTFAEIPDPERTRSDCHAWSSSPLYELLATVAGIRPASVGFETVIIAPHPGDLTWIKAGMPHEFGEITIDLKFAKDGSAKGTITLPEDLTGIFLWDHQTIDLTPGTQKISIKSMGSKFNSP
ncbi:MAG: alpha-L-rhamnosidase C-terminal domain-containing protein [Bacteroidales bacterium]